MKNAGMAGAVALVGIGLLSIGLQDLGRTSTAAGLITSQGFNSVNGSQGCPTRIFAPEVVVVQTRCGLVGITGEKTLLMADLMGLGYDQAIQMPYDNNGSLVPLQVRGRDFILTMDVDPLDLSFGDWEPGSFSNMNGAGLIDMDADGQLDLLVTARRGSEARYGYLPNVTRATPRLPADLNDDGRVDGADLGELFVQWTG